MAPEVSGPRIAPSPSGCRRRRREWIRRQDDDFDRYLRRYLFTEGSITEREESLERKKALAHEADGHDNGAGPAAPGASIGSLRRHR